jgi:hypothetical protein
MCMRVLLVLSSLFAVVLPAIGTAADFPSPAPLAVEDEGVTVERIVDRPRRVRVATRVYARCIKCRGGLPWGGLRKTYQVGLPWGGLPDYCPPVQAVREAVVVTKG